MAVGFALLGTLPLIGFVLLYQTHVEHAVVASLQRQLREAGRHALVSVNSLQEDATYVMPVVAATISSDLERFKGPEVYSVLHAAMAPNPAIDAMYASFEDGTHRVVTRVDQDRRRQDPRIPEQARWHSSWIDPFSVGPARARHRSFHSEWGTLLDARWSEPTTLDLRELSHYGRAAETRALAMVEPTINPDTRYPVVSLAEPLIVDDVFVGIVGVNLTFRHLSEHLARNRVSPSGLTVVLDPEGRVVAHPDPVFSARAAAADGGWPMLRDVAPPAFADALPHLLAGDADDALRIHEVAEVDGETYHLLASSFHPAGSEPWTVLTAAPESDFVGETRAALRILALAIGGITFLQLLLVALFARRIGSRIKGMSVLFRSLRRLQFEGPPMARARGVWIQELLELESGFQLLLRSFETFSRFIPRGVAAHLLTTDGPVRPSVEQRELALFFCDLQGFTSLAERAPPETLLRQVSEYFEVVTDAITEEAGTIDKFIGDAVMAFWGAPKESDNPALAASRAALRVRARFAVLSRRWEEEGLPPLRVRIGVHLAPVLVGTIGTKARLSYTALGDGVNVASRLEGANKELGTTICISDAVREAAVGLLCRPLRRLKVKGRSEPLLVHEPQGVEGVTGSELAASPTAKARIECGRAVLGALDAGERTRAAKILRQHLADDPHDDASVMLLDGLDGGHVGVQHSQ